MTIKPQRLHTRRDPYPVLLRRGLLSDIGELAARLAPGHRVMVVTQARLLRLHGSRLLGGFERAGAAGPGGGVTFHVTTLLEGERHKTLRTVSKLYDRMVAAKMTRDDAVIAFGGGVVGDTAGFAAATYLRGIAFAQVPTTLLAQIDSAIGGKVGVNHPRGKNLIGAVYRPRAVWIDPGVLQTLPERQFRSGLFELLKYGLIDKPSLFRRLEKLGAAATADSIEGCIADAVRSKLGVVRDDENERGRRRVLNLGHTIGHGLEAASDYRGLTHGEAVGWGMVGAVRLAARRGALKARTATRLERAIRGVGPLPSLKRLSRARVLEAIEQDKKQGATGLKFILPVGLGRVTIVDDFPLDEIAAVLPGLGVG